MAPMLDNEISTDSASTNTPPSLSKLSVLRRIKRGSNNSTTIDPSSFEGRGITYKGKLIGERDVCDARGAEMCAEAMQKAKSAVKAANVSKARILLQINQDGIKILDEKSHAVLHNFSVSRISFIARDKTDARAFGLIYGENPQSYKFYAIKTAQAADQAVLAIREMFKMVFEKKTKQMKPAIQHQEDIQKDIKKSSEGVADLLDLETEPQNIAEGVQQLHQLPVDPFGAGPFLDQFTESFNSTTSTVSNSGLSQSAASYSLNGSSLLTGPIVQDPFAANFGHTLPPAPSFPAPNCPIQQLQWSHAALVPPILQPMQVQNSQFCPMPIAVTQQQQFMATNPFVATSTMAIDPFKACSAVDWAFKENADAHTAASRSQPKMDMRWNEPSKRVTSLDEGFSKLVDMDVIIGPSKVKENPFHHIINPPKCSLNSMGSGSCAAAVNANSDPFGLDFFS